MKKLVFFIIFSFFIIGLSMKTFADGTSANTTSNPNAAAQKLKAKILNAISSIQESKTMKQKQTTIAQGNPVQAVNTANQSVNKNAGSGALNGFGSIISNQSNYKPKNIKDALNFYYKTHNFESMLSVYIKHPNQASKLTTNHFILHFIASAGMKDDMEVAKIIYIAFKYNKHLNPNYQGTVIINPEYLKRCSVSTTSIHWVTPIFMAAVNNLKIAYKVLTDYKANPDITSIIHHNKIVNTNSIGGFRYAASCSYAFYKTTLSAKEAKMYISFNRGIGLNYNSTTGPKGVSFLRNVFSVPTTWDFK